MMIARDADTSTARREGEMPMARNADSSTARREEEMLMARDADTSTARGKAVQDHVRLNELTNQSFLLSLYVFNPLFPSLSLRLSSSVSLLLFLSLALPVSFHLHLPFSRSLSLYIYIYLSHPPPFSLSPCLSFFLDLSLSLTLALSVYIHICLYLSPMCLPMSLVGGENLQPWSCAPFSLARKTDRAQSRSPPRTAKLGWHHEVQGLHYMNHHMHGCNSKTLRVSFPLLPANTLLHTCC